jgi:hypothetical protein
MAAETHDLVHSHDLKILRLIRRTLCVTGGTYKVAIVEH